MRRGCCPPGSRQPPWPRRHPRRRDRRRRRRHHGHVGPRRPPRPGTSTNAPADGSAMAGPSSSTTSDDHSQPQERKCLVSVYETEWESSELEGNEMETGEFGEMSGESNETEGFLGGLLSSVLGGLSGEAEGPLGETQELEAAAELLEIQSEAELEQFLGNLFKKVASGVGGFIKSGTGKALGGILKNVAKKALPVVGGALGSFV